VLDFAIWIILLSLVEKMYEDNKMAANAMAALINKVWQNFFFESIKCILLNNKCAADHSVNFC
jgi:hypothetical protein